mmetsp:Transcript_2644/g.9217  ORF Transcript_2644/g.9217 Transcript_2644/m.9217 type:complete len:314 (-) Transcript_2644:2264-3205(-)
MRLVLTRRAHRARLAAAAVPVRVAGAILSQHVELRTLRLRHLRRAVRAGDVDVVRARRHQAREDDGGREVGSIDGRSCVCVVAAGPRDDVSHARRRRVVVDGNGSARAGLVDLHVHTHRLVRECRHGRCLRERRWRRGARCCGHHPRRSHRVRGRLVVRGGKVHVVLRLVGQARQVDRQRVGCANRRTRGAGRSGCGAASCSARTHFSRARRGGAGRHRDGVQRAGLGQLRDGREGAYARTADLRPAGAEQRRQHIVEVERRGRLLRHQLARAVRVGRDEPEVELLLGVDARVGARDGLLEVDRLVHGDRDDA